MPALSVEAAAKLRSFLDVACSRENPGVASTAMQVVTSSGSPIFAHTAGSFIAAPPKDSAIVHASRKMLIDDIVPLLSSTKLIVTVAALQLVEKGLIDLDDPNLIEKLLPELVAKKVLLGFEDNQPGETGPRKPIFEERQSPITARMLLTNTAGLSYTFFSPLLFEYIGFSLDKTEGIDPWACMKVTPLTSQPGSLWSYGQSLDWMGVLVERLISTPIKDYLEKNIYQLLEMNDTSLDIDIKSREPSRVVPLHFKGPGGKFTCIPHTSRRAKLDESVPSEGPKQPLWGGGGIFSTAPDYCRLLSTLLNHGKCEATGKTILSSDSVASILTPALPEHFVSGYIQPATPGALLVNLEDLDPGINSGFGCAIQGSDRVQPNGKRGRRAGSGYWFGAMNTNWWLDPKSGIAAVIFSCSAPWNDPAWLSIVGELEGELYEGLKP